MIETERGTSFTADEGERFKHRDALVPLVERAVAQRSSDDLARLFADNAVCWGPYQTLSEAIDDPAIVSENPLFTELANASGVTYPVAGAPATLPALDRLSPGVAPRLGEHGDEILARVLGLSSGEIGRLHDDGLVATAQEAAR